MVRNFRYYDFDCLHDNNDNSQTFIDPLIFFAENPDGVPQFWLTTFKNVDMLSEMVQVRLLIFPPTSVTSI